MSARKVLVATAAALALAGSSVPVVNAQDDAGSGSLPISGLVGRHLEDGSVSGFSAGGTEGGGGEDAAVEDSGSALGADSTGSDESRLSELVPESEEICELPGLGGSVAKFYPLFGLTGVPTAVIDLVTTVLDTFPNLIELVGGEGAGAQLLSRTGSLNEGLCTAVLGGDMVLPPVTVIVDEDGAAVSTTTGTVNPDAGSSGSGGSLGTGAGETSGASAAPETVDADATASGSALSTTVPVPGR